jgi:hypothetical protein
MNRLLVDYPNKLEIIRKRCVSGEYKAYFTEEEWITCLQNHKSKFYTQYLIGVCTP